MRQIILIAHNLRSTHNVGSLLRTSEGLGINNVYLTGYSPYPKQKQDSRLPHIVRKVDAAIHKTALGAELSQAWEHYEDIFQLIYNLKRQGFTIAALEQTDQSTALPDYTDFGNIALIVGYEVSGLDQDVIKACDVTLEIPMFGKKESFNVVQAAAMAMYQLRFNNLD